MRAFRCVCVARVAVLIRWEREGEEVVEEEEERRGSIVARGRMEEGGIGGKGGGPFK